MSNTILLMSDITKSYGERKILDNLSFVLSRGDIVAVVGLSGAGKSTFLNIAGLLDNQFRGAMLVLEHKILPRKDYSSIRRDKMGFVFQSYYLLNQKTVLDNILMPFMYKNVHKDSYIDKIDSICETLQIKHLLKQKASNLSGGEKQRVAIARAILHEPDIIFCDEPTGNLDEENSLIVFECLKKEAKRGAGIVIVTHNKEIAALCDKTYFLKGGCLYEEAS